ncbi:hypothetical protein GCM10010109_34940 [Actinoplanes campanulatus]|nr:hypothetical protein GCM10010109_34940 [Actinoplanes campanulatus]GID35656.1 hypothetical protein Aca09nite_21620 [Actinoplanes campanulatus]
MDNPFAGEFQSSEVERTSADRSLPRTVPARMKTWPALTSLPEKAGSQMFRGSQVGWVDDLGGGEERVEGPLPPGRPGVAESGPDRLRQQPDGDQAVERLRGAQHGRDVSSVS